MGAYVTGHTDPAFEAVREVFESSFADGQNVGCAVAVYVRGRPVVDLWGGIADSRTGRAWERDTPCIAFSCTKAVTATAALMVAAEHGIAMEDPVARWWTEYGCAGKESTATADLLTHRAGVPAFDRAIDATAAADAAGMAALLAAQAPEWAPGTQHGYHALTFGWLVGELVRRHTDSTVGEFTHRRISPNLHIGADADVCARAARSEFPPAEQQIWQDEPEGIDAATVARMSVAYRDPQSMVLRAVANPFGSYNNPAVLAGGWPATGLVTTARALAGFYRALVQGRLLPPSLLRDATRERARGTDAVLALESAYGLGYMLPSQNFIVPESARATVFGHPGAGGSVGLGDLENQVAFAFIPNLRRDWLAGDRRAYRLIEAVYAAL
ncbi:MAG: putative esterase [Nocardia sp.]|uniref:serine hydrolase domain-containing protein n=1 Tax=Nocardia sp. TaxID=1821 RepID=UPI00260ABEC3|nr:serine hydrolase domain-containing protein [Nocardia sp.]MCU1645375.1 putative esterase [Nocardia sp.]